MDLGIKGKKALVTGGTRGIGKGIALNLAKEGVNVAVVSRSKEDVKELVKEMGGAKEGHYGISLDLVDQGSPNKLVKKLNNEFGHPDIVVHNLGGTLDITDPLCSVKDWRNIWRFNLEVAIELNIAFVPVMKKNKWGRIVHISSISSMENHGPVPYCSIKAALTAYSRSFGRVLAPDGIIVSAVLPGAIFTEKGYWDIALHERQEHVKKYLEERMAIKRFGTLDEVGGVVTFLCSQWASFCVGSVVGADGGQGRGYWGQ